MTDRYNTLTVVLEENLRSDDAQPLIDAIRMFKGVVDVGAHVADPATYAANTRARTELRAGLFELLRRDGWP